MAYRRTTSPAFWPLSLAETKMMLKVDGTEEDTYIGSLIAAASDFCEKYTGLLLSSVTIEQFWDDWPTLELDLAVEPVTAFTKVEYYNEAGTLTTISSGNYYVDTVSSPARVVPYASYSWPTTQERPNAIVATYVAGAASADDVSESIKQAMRLLIAYWYQNREDDAIDKLKNPSVTAAQRLLNNIRWIGC